MKINIYKQIREQLETLEDRVPVSDVEGQLIAFEGFELAYKARFAKPSEQAALYLRAKGKASELKKHLEASS